MGDKREKKKKEKREKQLGGRERHVGEERIRKKEAEEGG